MSKDKHINQTSRLLDEIKPYNDYGYAVNIKWRPRITKLMKRLLKRGKLVRERHASGGNKRVTVLKIPAR